MNSEDLELCLQKVRGFVYDEEKIITISWLCNKLKMESRKCQEVLKQFAEDEKSKIGITYVVIGRLKTTDHAAVVHANSEQLQEKKNLFKSPVNYIYSIQKSLDVDLNAVANVNLFVNMENPLLGSIVNKNAIKRQIIEKTPIPSVNRAQPMDKSKGSHLFAKTSSSTEVKSKPIAEIKEKPKGKKESPENKVKKNKSIANMFTAKNVTKKEPKEEPMEVEETKPAKLKLIDSESDEEPPKKVEKKEKKKSKRSRNDTSKERPQKRRKRILEPHESDDDIFEDADKEEPESSVIMDSDEDTQPLYKQKPLAPKNKNRKFVEKTYTDDEGYIVTKKEWVSASEAETDEEVENKEKNLQQVPEVKEKPKPKEAEIKKPNGKTSGKKLPKTNSANQPTLMNFFKKK